MVRTTEGLSGSDFIAPGPSQGPFFFLNQSSFETKFTSGSGIGYIQGGVARSRNSGLISLFLIVGYFLFSPIFLNWDFIFLGSKTTADGYCSHEIKRCLLLERKGMNNLDSTLKSRDITLPTKVPLVKAMVFPVVMYGCESWTV